MYTADDWPIACKMNFGPMTEDGIPTVEAPADVWRDQLLQVSELGFDHIDPVDDWLRIGDMTDERFAELKACIADAGLLVPAVSIGRKSVIDPTDGDENLAMVHRTIDRAAELGAGIVDVGFQSHLGEGQKKALWFWLSDDGHHDDPKYYDLAVERIRDLADHCQRNGMELSLEMYEDTFLGMPDDAVKFYKDVDHPAVGLNPDLGNIIRLHRPLPSYQSMHETVLPYSNYWHIKNYFRDEDPATGSYFSAPASLKEGVVDYRAMIRRALKLGYTGPFMTEHYGSDWLGIGADNMLYIRQVLRSALR